MENKIQEKEKIKTESTVHDFDNKELGLGMTSRDMSSSWCIHGMHMYSRD